ncbi:MAG TPA: DUF3099 domain-containing protein [Streptosporangiaceae bacterium]|nr:DUF3099 domain-containing protein [Streptosporangiaceae bacterium]
MRRVRRPGAHLVTEAREPRSEDIASRERRYLIMMGFRIVCFVATVVLYAQGAGWYAAFPAAGAIVIPYFAVVFANAARVPASGKGFRAYEPNLPVRHQPPGPESGDGTPGAGHNTGGDAGHGTPGSGEDQ